MKIRQTKHANPKRKGDVAATAIAVASVVGVLALAFFAPQSTPSEDRETQEHVVFADGIAESAIHLAAAKLWSDCRRANPEVGDSGQSMCAYLDNKGISVQGEDGAWDYLPELGVHQDQDGAYPLAGGFVLSLVVIRREAVDGLELEFACLASMGEGTPERWVRRVYDSAGHPKEE